MSITYQQFDSNLASKGIKVIKHCTVDVALGHTQSDRPNEMHVCSSDKLGIRTHEGIHLLQFRYGVNKVEEMLSKCHKGDWSEYKSDAMEYQAYNYAGTTCATQVVLDNLNHYIPSVVKPEPSASGITILMFSSIPLLLISIIGAVFYNPKE